MITTNLIVLLLTSRPAISEPCANATLTDRPQSVIRGVTYHPNSPLYGGCNLDIIGALGKKVPIQMETAFPPSSTTPPFTVYGGVTLKIKDCDQVTAGAFWTKCRFSTTDGKEANICGVTDSKFTLVVANMMLGDESKKKVPITTRKGLSLACDVVQVKTNPKGTSEWHYGGAISKCIFWDENGFNPGKDKSKDARFAACVRAVRADYCGDGITHTNFDLPLDVYDTDGTVKMEKPDWCLEAGWNAEAATCIWESRLNFVNGQSPFGISCLNEVTQDQTDEEGHKHACKKQEDYKKSTLRTRVTVPSSDSCNKP